MRRRMKKKKRKKMEERGGMEGPAPDIRPFSHIRGSPCSMHIFCPSALPPVWDRQYLCACVHYTHIHIYIHTYIFSTKRKTWTSFLTHWCTQCSAESKPDSPELLSNKMFTTQQIQEFPKPLVFPRS